MVFGSQTVRRPGVYTSVSTAGLSPIIAGAPNNLALVGVGMGSEPQTVQVWGSPMDVRTLRGGDLQNGTLFAFNPAVGIGATTVYTVRVNRAVPASTTLLSAGGNPTIVATATDAGTWTNGIALRVAPGSTAGTVDVSVQYTPDNFVKTSPDLGQVLSLQYTGNGTSATVTVTDSLSAPSQPVLATGTGGALASGTVVFVKVTAVNASGESLPSSEALVTAKAASASVSVSETLVPGATSYNIYATTSGSGLEVLQANTKVFPYVLNSITAVGAVPPTTNTTGPDLVTTVTGQTDSSASLDWNLSSGAYNTIQGLSAAFNAEPGYVASVLGQDIAPMPSSYLDAVTAQNIASATTLTAGQGSVIYWVNALGGGYVTLAAVSGGSTSAPGSTQGWVLLTGGSEGPTPTLNDWQDALALLENKPVDIIVPLTSDAAIQASFDATNHNLANRGIAYRTGIYGGALGETYTTTLGRAQALNTDRGMLAAPGFYQNDVNGQYTLFPPYILAALYGGLAAGLAVSTPMTYKQPNVLALEQSYSGTVVDTLINAGVAVTIPMRRGGFRIEKGVTTAAAGTLYNVEYSVLRAADYIREQLAVALDTLIGGDSQGKITVAEMTARAVQVLSAGVADGIIAGYSALTNIAVSSQSPTAYVVPVTISILDPINDILVPINLAA